jgi:GxxExxY protein
MLTDPEDVAAEIVDASVKLHIRVGPGLLESVYQLLLVKELRRRGLFVEDQKDVSFEFDGEIIENGFKVDLLVNHVVVVELKSVQQLAPVHFKQVLTYVRLLNLKLGLLINFGAPVLKSGLHRVINTQAPSRLRERPPLEPGQRGGG